MRARGALHPAAVFYARGVVLGLDDSAWHTYRLTDASRRRGDVLTATVESGNPYARELSALSGRGATLLVCDNALADLATYLVVQAGFNERPVEALHADLRQRLLPSALLVPAGVAALNEAQEARLRSSKHRNERPTQFAAAPAGAISARFRSRICSEIVPCTIARTIPCASTKIVSGSDRAPYEAAN